MIVILWKYIYEMLLKKYYFVFDKDKDKENIQALKTGNCYRVITSEHLKLLDVSNFLTAGTSLDKWLIAYKCEVEKLFSLMNG